MIYFTEGTLGSGKTTLAEKYLSSFLEQGIPTTLYHEHDRNNPLDLTCRAYLDKDFYEEYKQRLTFAFQKNYGEEWKCANEKIAMSTEPCLDGYIVHLPSLLSNKKVKLELELLRDKMISGGDLPVELYLSIFFTRWKRYFSTFNAKGTLIFEGALLQNPLIDLIACYQLKMEELLQLYNQLMITFKEHQYSVQYIRVDNVFSIIKYAARERQGNVPLWINSLIQWVENSSYGKINKLCGFDGVVDFCQTLDDTARYLLENTELSYSYIERTLTHA